MNPSISVSYSMSFIAIIPVSLHHKCFSNNPNIQYDTDIIGIAMILMLYDKDIDGFIVRWTHVV